MKCSAIILPLFFAFHKFFIPKPQHTLEIKMPGSPVPKGTHEWSFPPIILRPSGPPDLIKTTS